ncbi:MAG: histidine kinase [Polyangiales bacterium]
MRDAVAAPGARVADTREPMLRWWPRYRPGSVEIGGGGRGLLLLMGVSIATFIAVFSLPPVARATGIPPLRVALLLGGYYAAMVFNDLVLHPAALRSPRGFDAQIATLFAYNEAFCLGLVVLSNQPWSPLWLATVMWAYFTGAWQEIDASVFALASHVAGPLLTIPIFLARGVPAAQAVAGPLLAATVCGVAYTQLASTRYAWRRERRAAQAEIDRYRAQAEALERDRVARDLHDSLGSALALTASYAEVMSRHADDPEAVRRIASALREVGREGLDELRALLDAISPHDATVEAFVRTAERMADRCEAAWSIPVELRVEGDRGRALPGMLHLAAARVLQEALRNAARHARAARVECVVEVSDAALSITVSDDGEGFDAARAGAGGRGLAGMRDRARELGGRFEVSSRAEGGTVLRWAAPWT